MARFEVEIRGEDLGRAMRSLNSADIPTIGSGQPGDAPPARTGRLARNTLLVLLVVIVLAFLVERLISPGPDEGGDSNAGAIVLYVLPFVLFLGFWLLMRRMRRGDGRVTLKAVLEAESAAEAEAEVNRHLPGEGGYHLAGTRVRR